MRDKQIDVKAGLDFRIARPLSDNKSRGIWETTMAMPRRSLKTAFDRSYRAIIARTN
jgi:hypothetical protein